MRNSVMAYLTLVIVALAAPVLADPEISGFTEKYENGVTAQLFGKSFGINELLVLQAEPVEKNQQLAGAVILGDSQRYDDCQQRHQLPVSVWTDQEITLEFQVPDNLRTELLYLFVLDREGNPSPGFGPLEYGKGIPDPLAPGRPGKPMVIRQSP